MSINVHRFLSFFLYDLLQVSSFRVLLGNIEIVELQCAEGASPAGDDEGIEGMLVRKHEWESAAKRASNRFVTLHSF